MYIIPYILLHLIATDEQYLHLDMLAVFLLLSLPTCVNRFSLQIIVINIGTLMINTAYVYKERRVTRQRVD
jgi:hypothetical protein